MLSTLKPLLSQSASADQIAQQIRDAFGLSAEAVEVTTIDTSITLPPWWDSAVKKGGISIVWSKGATSYSLDMRDNHARAVNVLYDRTQLSVDQAMNCLGKPEKYWGYYHLGHSPQTRSAELFMFYPESSFRVRADETKNGDQPPTFSSRSRVTQIWFVPPGAKTDVLTDFAVGLSPDRPEELARQIRPWPATWEEIVLSSSY
jgi:hypothetical protein